MKASPLVSAIMPVYRQERYVGDALRTVLAQDYAPLEIIVADDASPDGTVAEIMKTVQVYRGPHRVRVLRGERNRGVENYHQLYAAAEGELLVECHSDDLAYPDRVSRLVAAWQQSNASLITSNAICIDAKGKAQQPVFEPRLDYPTGPVDIARDGWRPWLLGATFAYAPDLITTFAPLLRKRAPIEVDWILPFRASLMRGIHVVEAPLLEYRVHDANATAQATARGAKERLVGLEASSAQRLAQLLYMLDTLAKPPAPALAGARHVEIRQTLLQSIVKTGFRWSEHRHALRSGGFKLRWLPPG